MRCRVRWLLSNGGVIEGCQREPAAFADFICEHEHAEFDVPVCLDHLRLRLQCAECWRKVLEVVFVQTFNVRELEGSPQ